MYYHHAHKDLKGYKQIHSAIIIGIAFSVIGCSTESKQSAMPALFNTKAEAEEAAKNFNCTGAHKMGDQWMPCKSHKNHEKHKKHSGHGHHHHHH